MRGGSNQDFPGLEGPEIAVRVIINETNASPRRTHYSRYTIHCRCGVPPLPSSRSSSEAPGGDIYRRGNAQHYQSAISTLIKQPRHLSFVANLIKLVPGFPLIARNSICGFKNRDIHTSLTTSGTQRYPSHSQIEALHRRIIFGDDVWWQKDEIHEVSHFEAFYLRNGQSYARNCNDLSCR